MSLKARLEYNFWGLTAGYHFVTWSVDNEKIASEFSIFITFSVWVLSKLYNNRKTLDTLDRSSSAAVGRVVGPGCPLTMFRFGIVPVITVVILANIICSRKLWRSCNIRLLLPPPTPSRSQSDPESFKFQEIILGLATPASSTYVTYRGYTTHLSSQQSNISGIFCLKFSGYFEEVVNTVRRVRTPTGSFSSDNNGVLNHSGD